MPSYTDRQGNKTSYSLDEHGRITQNVFEYGDDGTGFEDGDIVAVVEYYSYSASGHRSYEHKRYTKEQWGE